MKKQKIRTYARKGKTIRQVAALPFRRRSDGGLEVMLVTSRQTRRFVLPKGWPMKRLADWEAAAVEAAEEAGLKGTAAHQPIGRYTYWKRLKDVFVPILVDVYPFEVEGKADGWKEARQRRRSWVAATEAWSLVDEPELISLLRRFASIDDEEV